MRRAVIVGGASVCQALRFGTPGSGWHVGSTGSVPGWRRAGTAALTVRPVFTANSGQTALTCGYDAGSRDPEGVAVAGWRRQSAGWSGTCCVQQACPGVTGLVFIRCGWGVVGAVGGHRGGWLVGTKGLDVAFVLIALVLQGLVFGFFCGYIAKEKGRSYGSWFALGFFFSILAVFALIAVPKIESAARVLGVFSGQRDAELPVYQLFLTKRFGIEKNNTLDKFVIGNDVFDDLPAALADADARYGQQMAELAAQKLQFEREAAQPELARQQAIRKAMPWAIGVAVVVCVVGGLLVRQHSMVIKDCADCPEMVAIPAGSFEMGSGASGSPDEKPQHEVKLAGFLLGRTEVTQGQWRAVMGSNPSHFKDCGDDCPVESISWDDAQLFASKLSQKTGKSYRPGRLHEGSVAQCAISPSSFSR